MAHVKPYFLISVFVRGDALCALNVFMKQLKSLNPQSRAILVTVSEVSRSFLAALSIR